MLVCFKLIKKQLRIKYQYKPFILINFLVRHAEEDSESSDDSMASDKDIGSIKGKCNPLN